MSRITRTRRSLLGALALTLLAAPLHAAISMTPLSTFGTNGWLAPGSSTYLGIANNERGIAFGNGHLYLVSRTGGTFVRILDPNSGADLGALSTTGVTGGTFALSQIVTGADGAIYASNLTTSISTSPYKVYKWTSEAAAPTVALSTTSLLGAARLGDDLAAIGSGSSTLLAAGFNSSPVITGNNGYAIIDPTAGTASAVGFSTNPPAAGDFRLGITFSDSSHVLGSPGSSLYRYSSFSGTTGTLIASPAFPDPAGATADRLLAYATVGGIPLLAVQSTGDSHVSLYDDTNPSAPVYLTAGNTTTGSLTTNANATGELAWNVAPDGMSATLYAMSTNQGIQAFSISIPEPTSLLAACGLAFPLLRRRRA